MIFIAEQTLIYGGTVSISEPRHLLNHLKGWQESQTDNAWLELSAFPRPAVKHSIK